MNKQEAIESLQDVAQRVFYRTGSRSVYIDKIVEIINQIDEPQKVVVPKFVAEWLEWCKTNDVTLLGAISPIDELGSAICNDKRVESLAASRWAQRNQDTFARAWLDGHTVEQEKLYTVEIPNPNLKVHTILQKVGNGLALIMVTNARWRDWAESKVTESEIKKDFDFLWQFAKEVEEK